jgi:hypothetical protein
MGRLDAGQKFGKRGIILKADQRATNIKNNRVVTTILDHEFVNLVRE